MTLSLSPAAVCQCFTLVSLCTAIADPNWIQVRNGTDPNSRQLIYGVAFTLHSQQNLTDTDPLGGMNGWGMWLLYALASLCYCTVLLSSASFILDFMEARNSRPRLVALLHVCTAVVCLGALCVCGTCLYVISHNLKKSRTGLFWSSDGEMQLWALPGESFYIAVLAQVFAWLASGLSLRNCTETATRRGYMPIEPGDSDSEPSFGREAGQVWGEVFPD